MNLKEIELFHKENSTKKESNVFSQNNGQKPLEIGDIITFALANKYELNSIYLLSDEINGNDFGQILVCLGNEFNEGSNDLLYVPSSFFFRRLALKDINTDERFLPTVDGKSFTGLGLSIIKNELANKSVQLDTIDTVATRFNPEAHIRNWKSLSKTNKRTNKK